MILSEVQSLYAYDSLGRKTSRMDNDTWEYYIYDGMNLVADYDAYNGRIIRTYTYGPGVDNIQSMTIYDEYGGSETYYYIKDASNTVHVLVDEDGLIVEYYYYDAYGNLMKIRDKDYNLITESVYGNRFLFQGREYDYDTALYYFRARWYEPETGRWLSPDPIGISGGLNLYTFCGNDPVNFVDPEGTDVWLSVRPVEGWECFDHMSINVGNPNGRYVKYSISASTDNLFCIMVGCKSSWDSSEYDVDPCRKKFEKEFPRLKDPSKNPPAWFDGDRILIDTMIRCNEMVDIQAQSYIASQKDHWTYYSFLFCNCTNFSNAMYYQLISKKILPVPIQ